MSQVTLQKSYKLNRKLQLMINAKETYLSNDIPCQIAKCSFCQNINNELDNNKIFIIDDEVLAEYTDLIEQSLMKSIIVLQSQANRLKKKQQVTNLIESTFSKQIYVYPDDFSIYTQGDYPILLLAQWYYKHQQFIKQQYEVILITQKYQLHNLASEKGIKVLTIQDYVKQYEPDSDLIEYLGFDFEEEIEGEPLFQEHISIEEAIKLIKQGLLFEGRIAFNRNDITQSRIFVKNYQLEVKIKDTNRALNGDRVAVQLLPEEEWQQQERIINFEDDEEVIEDKYLNENNLKDLYQKIKQNNLIPFGKVVSILERTDRFYCGHVEEQIFHPADNRYPQFYLCHSKYQKLQDKKIQVQFTKWPSTSIFPQCKLKKILGNAGDMKVEGDVILLEHNVEIREFSHQVLSCLPQDGDKYQIPEEEIKKRWDLRSIPICSIDPIGCKDIDDALHCRIVGDDLYEVGVHIADVSYFVKPDTPIDKEAAHRCTTVYLVDRRTDMLPKLLTENLCSLVSNVDRQAFSVLWTMNSNGEIKNVKFGKSVIRSIASLHYGQAQEMIDNEQDQSVLTQSIRNLNMLAKKLKQQRIDAGALTLASNQVKFSFDEETHNPTDVRMYNLYQTNSLVEEFMLLANISVATKILERFPSISVLRRHQDPKMKSLLELQQLMRDLGYQFEFDTSLQLSQSLDQIQRQDEFFNKLIRMITTRCMNEALYTCTADVDYAELYHYGLAAELYTHFTSPIRRYADVLVHRLLAAAIDLESLPASMSNKIRISRICDKLNMRHRMARFASRASSDYHTYLFFKNKQQTRDQAIITGITAKGASVMLPRYGLEGFIQGQPDEKNKLYVQIQGQQHKIFDYIEVEIVVELRGFHKVIKMNYIRK